MTQVAQNTVTPGNTSGGGRSAAMPQEIESDKQFHLKAQAQP